MPAETEKQGKSPADTHAQLFVLKESSTCKELREGRNEGDCKILASPGEIAVRMLKDG